MDALCGFCAEPLPGLRSHGNALAGPQPFDEFLLQPLLLQLLQVFTDQPTDIVTRRAIVRLLGTLFDELFEIFGERNPVMAMSSLWVGIRFLLL